jgi:glucose-1-phosphatase
VVPTGRRHCASTTVCTGPRHTKTIETFKLAAMRYSVDCIVFDFGRVLVDFDFTRAFQHWADASGLRCIDVERKFEVDEHYRAHERGEINASQYFSHLRTLLGVRLSDQEFLFGWNSIFLDPLPGIGTLLHDLQSLLPLYVFSNTNAAHFEFWSQRYSKLLSPFRQIVCSHELGARKPNEEAFSRLAARLLCQPGGILFLDDLAENVAGAVSAGLRGHRVIAEAEIRRLLTSEYQIPLKS